MRKQILTALAAVALCAAGFTTVMASAQPALVAVSVATASAPATAAAAVDVKNTKCMVMNDDDVAKGKTVTYEGKIYHFCCGKCIKKFKADPEKYIKAFEADPAAYGVK